MDTQPRHDRGVWLVHGSAAIFFSVLALVRTGPALFSGAERVVGRNTVDTWIHMWAFWRARYALEGQDEGYLVSHLLAWPGQYREIIAVFDPLLPLATVPCQWVVGIVPTTNLAVTAGLLTSGLAGYALVWSLTHKTPPSLLGGLIVAMNPVTYRLVDEGFFEYAWWGLVPLALALLVGIGKQRRWARAAAYAGVVAVVCTTSVYCACVLALVALVALGWDLARRKVRAVHALRAHAVAGVVMLPVVIVWFVALGGLEYRGVALDIDLFGAVERAAQGGEALPTELRMLLQRSLDLGEMFGTGAARRPHAVIAWEWGPLLLLAGLALLDGRVRRRHGHWYVSGAVCLVLALGPCLAAHDAVLSSWALPYTWLAEGLPGFSRVKFPGRLALGSILAVAVLAPLGLRALTRRLLGENSPHEDLSQIIGLAVVAAWFIAPLDVGPSQSSTRASVPEGYGAVIAHPGEFAVLELPLKGDTARRMYYQTAHGHPIYRGVVPDWYVRVEGETGVLGNTLVQQLQPDWDHLFWVPADLRSPRGGSVAAADIAALADMGFGFLVLHRDGYHRNAEWDSARDLCGRWLGTPQHVDRDLAVWSLAGNDEPMAAAGRPTGFGAVGLTRPDISTLDRDEPRAVEVTFDDPALRVEFVLPASVLQFGEEDIGYHNGYVETHDLELGCCEVARDVDLRHSRMWIERQSPARVVVRWRAAVTDDDGTVANHRLPAQHEAGSGDRVEEWYTLYPDGTFARQVTIHTALAIQARAHWGRRGAPYETQESSVIGAPGHHPTDDIDTGAVTLIDMDGEFRTISFRPYPAETDLMAGANIQVVNIEGRYRPFTIMPPGDTTILPYHGSPEDHRHLDHTTFITWPGGQEFPDGYTTALTHLIQWDFHDRGTDHLTQVYLSGMTRAQDDAALAGEMVNLARSWLSPPQVTVQGGPEASVTYDRAQRAFVVTAAGGAPVSLDFEASEEAPLLDPCFVLAGWGAGPLQLSRDGEILDEGRDYRAGLEAIGESTDRVLWLPLGATSPTRFLIEPRSQP